MTDSMNSGRWRKGQSGNAAGRKPGSGEVAKLRDAIARDVPAIIEKLKAAALGGDVGAARLLLERVIAPLKADEQTVLLELPDGAFTDQGRAVMAAVAAGKLAPGQGATLLGSLGTLAGLAKVDDLAARVAALEERHGVAGSKD